MDTVVVTGCGGLIGLEAAEFFLSKGLRVVGIDNNLREYFFGQDGSVESNLDKLRQLPNFHLHYVDIRDRANLESIFSVRAGDIKAVIHTAAQPSHDWAVKEPLTDFNVNATGTLNLLELTRKYAPKATFIFTSTNKVYGDSPNQLPLLELESRYEIDYNHPYFCGIPETHTIDQSKHSLFGCSKLAADIYVQEYGRYFGMNTVVFRGGCLTGSKHRGAELHGFLNYLVKCAIEGKTYTIHGYKGKQVRDNIHSSDLVAAFYEVYQSPRSGEVYNIGGGRDSNCSVLEAIEMIEQTVGTTMKIVYSDTNRSGDHQWWISDTAKFQRHYPNWSCKYSIKGIIEELVANYKHEQLPVSVSAGQDSE